MEIQKLPHIEQYLNACVQCGYCISVCEAHHQTPWESDTPRGKIYYLRQLDLKATGAMDKVLGRDIQVSPEFVDAMYKCTGCGNCEAVCHANIPLTDLWETMRNWLVIHGYGPMPVHKTMAKKVKFTIRTTRTPRNGATGGRRRSRGTTRQTPFSLPVAPVRTGNRAFHRTVSVFSTGPASG